MTNNMLSEPEKWVDEHGDSLYGYAMFRLRDQHAAEDAVQETLLAALHARDQYRGQGSERTWLIGILKNKIIDHFRRISRSREIAPANYDEQEEYDPFERAGQRTGHWRADFAPTNWQLDASTVLESKEFWVTFDRCLSQLPQKTAMAFTLREIDGLSSEEVCEVLNVSQNNLWVMLHRARLKLRSSLESQWFDSKSRSSVRRANKPAISPPMTEVLLLNRPVGRPSIAV